GIGSSSWARRGGGMGVFVPPGSLCPLGLCAPWVFMPPGSLCLVGIPGEVLQERIGAEEGLQKEDLKGAGNSGQYLAAGAPEEPSREEMPDLFQTAAHEEPSGSADLLGKPEKSVGRTARPYCCPACGKGFIQKHHLQKHQRIHGRLYRCIECTESFPMQTLLEEHQRRHTQQRPFQCNGCSKSFRHRQSLNHHQKVHAVANAPAASLPNRGPGTDPCKPLNQDNP
uniref:C2H2-type domain-containing protein n=1 Tax=Phasianus colchicus TaxID=9054 RepID=A0A669QJQ0_PHACC